MLLDLWTLVREEEEAGPDIRIAALLAPLPERHLERLRARRPVHATAEGHVLVVGRSRPVGVGVAARGGVRPRGELRAVAASAQAKAAVRVVGTTDREERAVEELLVMLVGIALA